MPAFYIVSVYTPNAQNANEGELKPRRLPYRMKWEDDFRAYLMELDKKNRSSCVETSTWRTRRST